MSGAHLNPKSGEPVQIHQKDGPVYNFFLFNPGTYTISVHGDMFQFTTSDPAPLVAAPASASSQSQQPAQELSNDRDRDAAPCGVAKKRRSDDPEHEDTRGKKPRLVEEPQVGTEKTVDPNEEKKDVGTDAVTAGTSCTCTRPATVEAEKVEETAAEVKIPAPPPKSPQRDGTGQNGGIPVCGRGTPNRGGRGGAQAQQYTPAANATLGNMLGGGGYQGRGGPPPTMGWPNITIRGGGARGGGGQLYTLGGIPTPGNTRERGGHPGSGLVRGFPGRGGYW